MELSHGQLSPASIRSSDGIKKLLQMDRKAPRGPFRFTLLALHMAGLA